MKFLLLFHIDRKAIFPSWFFESRPILPCVVRENWHYALKVVLQNVDTDLFEAKVVPFSVNAKINAITNPRAI